MTRRPRAGRATRRGFTLVEMLVSVTLVLMMMLMFAEIFSLAQGTISTQKGIAENDQRARILSEVLRADLTDRSFVSVYPFRSEPTASFAVSEADRQLLDLRQGYFSISENNPDDPTDDVLQFTVRAKGTGDRLYGLATDVPNGGTAPPDADFREPEFDDGIPGNGSGMSEAAEVSYFLRNGNLYRTSLLIRDPHFDPRGPSTPSWWTDLAPSFWANFDYSVYLWMNGGVYTPQFHSALTGLVNDPVAAVSEFFAPTGTGELFLPRGLGAPQLRFGHIAYDPGAAGVVQGFPREFLTVPSDFDSVVPIPPSPTPKKTGFFGRFLTSERSDSDFSFPRSGPLAGAQWAPFTGVALTDSNGNGLVDPFESTARRGTDLMLSNVHGFDIQVWDDVVGDFVNLGHGLSGPNPYKAGRPVEEGFFHRNKLCRPFYYDSSRDGPWPTSTDPVDNGYNLRFDSGAVATDFGNRYDTWHPYMYVREGTAPAYRFPRAGRAPYRPQTDNPLDPNVPAFRSVEVEFGTDDTGTQVGTEAPLRAIRIVIRYLDSHSGQMRQTTIEKSLIGP